MARLSQTRDQASLSLSRVYAIAPSFILLRSGLPFPAQPPTVPYHTPLQLVVICLPVCLLYRLSQLCVPGQFRHACFCFFSPTTFFKERDFEVEQKENSASELVNHEKAKLIVKTFAFCYSLNNYLVKHQLNCRRYHHGCWQLFVVENG